jgi:hypothetical protein
VYTVNRPGTNFHSTAGCIWGILFLAWKAFFDSGLKGGEKEVRGRREKEEKGKRGEEG